MKRSQHKPRSCRKKSSESENYGPSKESTKSGVNKSDHQKYIKSYEEPLDKDFQIDAEFFGFDTPQNPLSDPNSQLQFFPPFSFGPYCNNGEVSGHGKVSQFHPICCKIKRLFDSGFDRKQIEEYVLG